MEELYNLFWDLGIHKNYKGRFQAAVAISLVLHEEAELKLVTQKLYPMVADKFQTKNGNIERNIRTVVFNCWEYGNRELLHEMAGYKLRRQPSASEFIGIVAHYMKRQSRS